MLAERRVSTSPNYLCEPTLLMNADLPMPEVRRRLSWVEFLEPLSEEELDGLVGHASFVRLAARE